LWPMLSVGARLGAIIKGPCMIHGPLRPELST
jgi:hypothetical protein